MPKLSPTLRIPLQLREDCTSHHVRRLEAATTSKNKTHGWQSVGFNWFSIKRFSQLANQYLLSSSGAVFCQLTVPLTNVAFAPLGVISKQYTG